MSHVYFRSAPTTVASPATMEGYAKLTIKFQAKLHCTATAIAESRTSVAKISAMSSHAIGPKEICE